MKQYSKVLIEKKKQTNVSRAFGFALPLGAVSVSFAIPLAHYFGTKHFYLLGISHKYLVCKPPPEKKYILHHNDCLKISWDDSSVILRRNENRRFAPVMHVKLTTRQNYNAEFIKRNKNNQDRIMWCKYLDYDHKLAIFELPKPLFQSEVRYKPMD